MSSRSDENTPFLKPEEVQSLQLLLSRCALWSKTPITIMPHQFYVYGSNNTFVERTRAPGVIL